MEEEEEEDGGVGGVVGVSMMMRGGLVRLLGAVGAVARGKLLCRMELKVHTMAFHAC